MQKAFAANGIAEDKRACEHVRKPPNNDRIEYQQMNIAADQAGMLFRRVRLNRVLKEYIN